ncbi:MAG: DUF6941 family protein [Planctomycetota bacterium]|jgi:hypothetical protein
MPPLPSVKAILVCDQIIHEYGTNKKSLIGIFEDIHLTNFPFRYPRVAVYVNLTDAHGKYSLGLKLIDSSDGSELGRGFTPGVDIDSPLRTCEFALQIQNLIFRKPGAYEFQVYANDELLATKAFNVKKAEVRRSPLPPF